MPKCEHCDGIGMGTPHPEYGYECECFISSNFDHLLYDNGGDDYGCKIHHKTLRFLDEYCGETECFGDRFCSTIGGMNKDGSIIYQEPHKKTVAQWEKRDRQFKRICKRLEARLKEDEKCHTN
jgi:hypothetical protein